MWKFWRRTKVKEPRARSLERVAVINGELKASIAEIKSFSTSLAIKLERELTTLKNRVKVMSETASDGVVCTDFKGNVISVNGAFKRMFGYEEDEVVGRNVSMFVPHGFESKHGKPHSRVVEEKALEYEQTDSAEDYYISVLNHTPRIESVSKDGRVVVCELTVSVINFDRKSHESIVFLCQLRDITERERLSERLGVLRSALDASDDPIVVFTNRAIVYKNESFCTMYPEIETFVDLRDRAVCRSRGCGACVMDRITLDDRNFTPEETKYLIARPVCGDQKHEFVVFPIKPRVKSDPTFFIGVFKIAS